jgi:hypothetical protein
LVEEACTVVAFQKTCTVEDASGQIAGVHSSEGVYTNVSHSTPRHDGQSPKRKPTGGAGVASKTNIAWESRVAESQVDKDLRDGMLGRRWATVPSLWDTFLAAVESEAAGLAGDGKEGLERFAVQSSTGGFCAVVAHEVNHKIVRSRCDESRERTAEVIRIV